jgi:hypothetical protein
MDNEDSCIYYNEEKGVAYPLCNGKIDDSKFLECECNNCCLFKNFEDEN